MGMLTMRRRVMGSKVSFDTNGYDFVDMGEAGIWATCNIGANNPEEAGLYFAWGENEPKTDYSWDTYKFGISDNITKYNEEDGLTELLPNDDAAHIIMGGTWRMPTSNDLNTLIRNTIPGDGADNKGWIVDYKSTGINGCVRKAPNGSEIFFPASGYFLNNEIKNFGNSVRIWLSNTHSINSSYSLHGYISTFTRSYNERFYGFSIRGFIPKE